MTETDHDAEASTEAALRVYREKRDFTSTAEPRGGSAVPDPDRPFFCVQKHAASALHYDLRLEVQGVLKSWAVPKGPSPDPTEKRLAVRVEDHPLEYGSFEGTIPAGEYGAGTVLLWDRGWWEPDRTRMKDPSQAPEVSLAGGELKIVLHGEKLTGSWTLVQMKGRGEKNWLLIKHRDESSRPGYEVVTEEPLSVATGRSIEEIAEDAESGAPEKAGEATAPPQARAGAPADDPESAQADQSPG